MKHQIIKPNGETYATVWAEGRLLNIQLFGAGLRGTHPTINMDLKVIPQLMAALEAIEAKLREKNT